MSPSTAIRRPAGSSCASGRSAARGRRRVGVVGVVDDDARRRRRGRPPSATGPDVADPSPSRHRVERDAGVERDRRGEQRVHDEVFAVHRELRPRALPHGDSSMKLGRSSSSTVIAGGADVGAVGAGRARRAATRAAVRARERVAGGVVGVEHAEPSAGSASNSSPFACATPCRPAEVLGVGEARRW